MIIFSFQAHLERIEADKEAVCYKKSFVRSWACSQFIMLSSEKSRLNNVRTNRNLFAKLGRVRVSKRNKEIMSSAFICRFINSHIYSLKDRF